MKKNILMYDSSHGYLSFVKKQLSADFEVSNLEKLEVSELNLDNFDAVIFIINNEIELVDLMYIYTKVKNLIISSSYRKLNQRLNELDNISILNLNNSKKQIVEQIRLLTDVFEINKHDLSTIESRVFA